MRLEENLPHVEAVRAMHSCDALLLVQNDSKSGQLCLPGKLFEYLACRKPVLTIGSNDSDLKVIIESWG